MTFTTNPHIFDDAHPAHSQHCCHQVSLMVNNKWSHRGRELSEHDGNRETTQVEQGEQRNRDQAPVVADMSIPPYRSWTSLFCREHSSLSEWPSLFCRASSPPCRSWTSIKIMTMTQTEQLWSRPKIKPRNSTDFSFKKCSPICSPGISL